MTVYEPAIFHCYEKHIIISAKEVMFLLAFVCLLGTLLKQLLMGIAILTKFSCKLGSDRGNNGLNSQLKSTIQKQRLVHVLIHPARPYILLQLNIYPQQIGFRPCINTW